MHTRRIVFAIAVLVLLSSFPAFVAKALPDVVATVNGEKITKEQLGSLLFDWQAPMVLDEWITYVIVGQEARNAGIQVTADEVKTKMEELKGNLPPGQDFEEMLRRSGLTMGHAFAITKMRLQAEGVIRKSLEITDADLADYRKARHILIRVPYSPPPTEGAEPPENPKDKEANEKMQSIAQEIKDGLSFEEAAKKYSEDESNKEDGGNLGWFWRNQMVPEFSEAAWKLDVGEMSEPVKTSYGYHLIKVEGIGEQATGEDRDSIRDMIFQRQFGEKYRDWLLSVRNRAEVTNFLEPEKPEPGAEVGPGAVRPSPRPPAPSPDTGEMMPEDDLPPPPPPVD